MFQMRYGDSDIDPNIIIENLKDYTTRLKGIRQSTEYTKPESSLKLPTDIDVLQAVKTLADQKVTSDLKYSLVIGIGGSNLGTKALYDSVMGYYDVLTPNRFPKLLFAETTDPKWLSSLAKLLQTATKAEELLVTVISKSGGTTETLANFEILMAALREKFPNINERVIAITDAGSKLMQAAQAKNISCLPIQAPVGGRYSVFSAVGLFPLLSVGVDIDQMRQGASEILDQCLDGDNLAAKSAAILSEQLKNGFNINDNFFFHPELESVGKWYRQLMGESIGKEKSFDGEVVHAGITPTISIGSTDLHSVGQLYLGGPKNKLTTFISSPQTTIVKVPSMRVFPELVPMIDEKSAGDIMAAILEGVKITYRNAELPFMEIILDTVDIRSAAAFLQFKMLEMMYLGQLLNVNSFDQPSVELYKIETKQLLER